MHAREGYEGGGRGRIDSYARSILLASMVCPAKRVSLSSLQFSETFLVTTRPLLTWLSTTLFNNN